ncbi:MAG: glutamate formimidoyltransferase [Actinomycetota bacterium]
MLECVPNFSEGRDKNVISHIVEAASKFTPIIDVHSDPDHNRSVLTMIGSPSDLIQAALAASHQAVRLIDISRHTGVHPRLGAMDVVPFIPLEQTPMHAAEAAAVEFAQTFAAQANVPCFLYGLIDLPQVRRQAFKSLSPDFGPDAPHATAGATVAGARGVMVAFNVVLDSNDLQAARRIARTIREQTPHIRALGFALESKGLVQVSMNLVEPMTTGVGTAFDAVATEAVSLGQTLAYSEIVGLVPRHALEGRQPSGLLLKAAPKYL